MQTHPDHGSAQSGSAQSGSWSVSAHDGPQGHWQCQCGKTLRFESQLAGKKGRCPACGRSFTIPQLAPVAGAELTLRGHTGPIQAVAFSPDARLLASAADVSSSGAAKSELAETILWDTLTGMPAAVLRWHRKPVTTLAFSPDGRLLATGSNDHLISLWNVERGLWNAVMGVHEIVLRGHQAPVTSVVFSPDGQKMASAAADRTIRFWNTPTWQLATTIDAQRSGEGHLAFSPCGQYLASVWTSRGPVTLWKTATGDRHLELRLHTEEDTSDFGVGFTADGARLVVLGDEQIRIWDLSTCQVLATFETAGSEALAVAPRVNLIATGGRHPGSGANVTMWDASSLVSMREFDGHSESVSAIAFSADGKLLASGGRDGITNLWLLR